MTRIYHVEALPHDEDETPATLGIYQTQERAREAITAEVQDTSTPNLEDYRIKILQEEKDVFVLDGTIHVNARGRITAYEGQDRMVY